MRQPFVVFGPHDDLWEPTGRAVAQLPGNHVLTGFLAWFLWRSYYLLRLPGLDRQLRVAFDWTLELLFPRDIAELRVDREEPGRHK